MATAGQSFEATLLFVAPIEDSMADMVDFIAMIAEAHGIEARPLPSRDRGFQIIDCDDMQILLAGTDVPMEAAHFLDSNRPERTVLNETAVLARLTAHQYSVTVMVADHPRAAPQDDPEREALKRQLCWQVAEALRDRKRATLVFWCETDTLYAAEEFARVGLDGDVPVDLPLTGPKTLEEAEVQLDLQRMLEAKAMTFIQTQIIQGKHRRKTRRGSILDRLMDHFQTSRTEASDDEPAAGTAPRGGSKMMRGTSMACSSAAIGICTMPALTTLVFG